MGLLSELLFGRPREKAGPPVGRGWPRDIDDKSWVGGYSIRDIEEMPTVEPNRLHWSERKIRKLARKARRAVARRKRSRKEGGLLDVMYLRGPILEFKAWRFPACLGDGWTQLGCELGSDGLLLKARIEQIFREVGLSDVELHRVGYDQRSFGGDIGREKERFFFEIRVAGLPGPGPHFSMWDRARMVD